ncbi:MAG: TRAP transporter substrate-binding protein DctP [Lachnospiraceae bacterium]|nr:TRAP transporter substrate-binding protein DctP [Lachnospiraceae bacterium]
MKRSIVKLLAVCLSLLVFAAMLAACSGNGGSQGGGQQGGGESQETTPEGSEQGGEEGGSVYDGPEIEIVIAYSNAEEYNKPILDACAEVTEKTGGKVTFVHHFNGSLVSIMEMAQAVTDGTIDMVDLPVMNFAQFVYTNRIPTVPFLGINGEAAALEYYTAMFEKFPQMQEELEKNNMHYIGIGSYIMETQIMLNIDGEFKTPESYKGLQLVSDGSTAMDEVWKSVGAAPVFQPPSEYFSALNSGNCDGMCNAVGAGVSFGVLPEACKQIVKFCEGGLSAKAKYIVFNNDRWNSLTPELQQIITEAFTSDTFKQAEIAQAKANNENAYAIAANGNVELVELTPEEYEQWRAIAEPVVRKYIESLEAEGYAGAVEMYEYALDITK